MTQENTGHDAPSPKQEGTTNGAKPQKRCTDEQYQQFLVVLFSLLKNSTQKTAGVTMETIIHELKKKMPETLDKTYGERLINADFVNRLLKSLKKLGCNHKYNKKDNSYTLDDINWMFPLDMLLSPVDQLALKLGWELLGSSVKVQEKGRMEKLHEETQKTLKGESSSALKDVFGSGEKDFRIITGSPAHSLPDENVFLNIVTGWMKQKAMVLTVKAKPTLLVPTQLQLSENGWLVQGELIHTGINNELSQKVMSPNMNISDISSAIIIPEFN